MPRETYPGRAGIVVAASPVRSLPRSAAPLPGSSAIQRAGPAARRALRSWCRRNTARGAHNAARNLDAANRPVWLCGNYSKTRWRYDGLVGPSTLDGIAGFIAPIWRGSVSRFFNNRSRFSGSTQRRQRDGGLNALTRPRAGVKCRGIPGPSLARSVLARVALALFCQNCLQRRTRRCSTEMIFCSAACAATICAV